MLSIVSAAGGYPTLSEYFHDVYLPAITSCRRPVRETTVRRRSAAVAWWSRLSGDPPLDRIDQACFDHFAERLRGAYYTRGRNWRRISPATRWTTLREVLTVIRSGARGLGLPLQVVLDTEVPAFFPKPIWTLDECRRIAAAVDCLPDYSPHFRPVWWDAGPYRGLVRASLALWYYTGWRASTAWSLPRSSLVEYRTGEWYLQTQDQVKTHRPDRVICHPQLVEQLHLLPASERLIPWPIRYDAFTRIHRRLTDIAGVRPYGVQCWRRVHAASLACLGLSFCESVAAGAMGHRDWRTTAQHYCDVRDLLIPRMEELFR